MTMTEEQIIEYYNEHYDKYAAARSLAKANKCTPKDIFELLQRKGIIGGGNDATPADPVPTEQQRAPNKKPKWTAEECELLLKLRADGVKWYDVAAQLNRKEKAVQFKYYELIKAQKSQSITTEVTAEPEAEEPEPCVADSAPPAGNIEQPHKGLPADSIHRLYLEVTGIISEKCSNVVPDTTVIEEQNHKLSLSFSAGDKRYNLILSQHNIIKEG